MRLNGGVYNLTDRKYWDYLSSRNIETGTNRDANDKALAVMPGRTGSWASTSTSDCPNNNAPAPARRPGIFIVEKDMIMPNAHPDLWQRYQPPKRPVPRNMPAISPRKWGSAKPS
nr:Uncharacterised protein [Klebsiella pneumoniae]